MGAIRQGDGTGDVGGRGSRSVRAGLVRDGRDGVRDRVPSLNCRGGNEGQRGGALLAASRF